MVKKYYAVVTRENDFNYIYDNWDDCSRFVKGTSFKYKSFKDIDKAKEFIFENLNINVDIIFAATGELISIKSETTICPFKGTIKDWFKGYSYEYEIEDLKDYLKDIVEEEYYTALKDLQTSNRS